MPNIRDLFERAQKKAGMTNKAVAEAAGMSRQAYYQMKSSNSVTVATLNKFAKVFGFDLLVINPVLMDETNAE